MALAGSPQLDLGARIREWRGANRRDRGPRLRAPVGPCLLLNNPDELGLNDTRDNAIAGPALADKEHAQHIQNDRPARRDPPESQPRRVSGGGKSFADISDLPGERRERGDFDPRCQKGGMRVNTRPHLSQRVRKSIVSRESPAHLLFSRPRRQRM